MNLNSGPKQIYLDGSISVIYIAFALIVHNLGVFEFTLFSVGGMLIGSLFLDVFVPTQGTHISPYLIAGIFLTYLGVIANGQSRFSRKQLIKAEINEAVIKKAASAYEISLTQEIEPE